MLVKEVERLVEGLEVQEVSVAEMAGPEVRMVSGLDHQVDISSLAEMVLD